MRPPEKSETGFSEAASAHGSWEYEIGSRAVRWSPSLFRIHGLVPGEFTPTYESVRALVHPDDVEEYARVVRDAIERRAGFTHQHRVVTPAGAERVLLVHGDYVPPAAGREERLVGVTQDVTGRQGIEERLWHLANHDSLSGLFNRRRFMEELDRELLAARRSGEPGAVLILDLDRFKDINDSLGHMAGDSLLAKVAEQLRGRLRATDTLARLGGDEFALVLPGCTTAEAREVAGELLDAIARQVSVRIAGIEHRVTASVGIAAFGTDGPRDADELLVEADLAMYRAKRDRRGGVDVFDRAMRAELAARVTLEGELRQALAEGALEVHYQPIVALADGAAVGCEALARWIHPRRGAVAPAEFIPLAEEAGLIAEVGRLVLDRACAQASAWRRAGHQVYVAVNVSPQQVVAGDIVEDVRTALATHRLPAPLLCLEITETTLLADNAPLRSALRELRRLGARIALDDFGGGASSLGLLRVLPLDQIKIDRMFVAGLGDHTDDRAIVAAVLSLAEELEVAVVAEGIETERQQGQLRELGCRFGQGFLYSPARPAAELDLSGYSAVVQPGIGDPLVIREFMRQIGIPARVGPG